MKRNNISALVLMASLCLVSAAHAAPPFFGGAKEEVHWQSSLQAAHQVAVTQNKPILIVFGADWCGYCKKLEKETLSAPIIAQLINSSFVPVHLDLDKSQRVADILEVEALPCTIIVSPNAELVGRIDGYLTPGPFQEKLTAAQNQFRQVQAAAPAGGTVR